MSQEFDIYNYILESADAVKKVVQDSEEVMRDSLNYLKNKEIKRIVVLGSGTSYHGVLGAKVSMADSLGIPVESMYPIDFKDNEIVKQDGTLVIGVSQAGRSTSTIEALKKARQFGYFTIAVTSEKDAPVANEADVWMELHTGEELSGPKTKGFIVTIAEVAYFAAKLAYNKGIISSDEVAKVEKRLLSSSENIPDIAAKSKIFIEDNIKELSSAKRIVIVGCEGNTAAMMEGALKVLEGVRCSVNGYELEEFMHGIYHSIWEDDYIIYLGKPGQYYDRMKRMKLYFETERTKHSFIITSDKYYTDDKKAFVYPFNDDDYFSSMEYVVPLQVLTKVVSQCNGIDCNIPSDPEFHQKMGSYQF